MNRRRVLYGGAAEDEYEFYKPGYVYAKIEVVSTPWNSPNKDKFKKFIIDGVEKDPSSLGSYWASVSGMTAGSIHDIYGLPISYSDVIEVIKPSSYFKILLCVIPEETKYFGAYIFNNSTGKVLCYPKSPPGFGGTAFTNSTITLYVPDGSLSEYQTAYAAFNLTIKPISQYKNDK